MTIKERNERIEKIEKRKTARYIYRKAIKANLIKKLPCKICGDKNSEGHHENLIDFPLKVVWLCAKHHQKIHRKNKIIKGKSKTIWVRVNKKTYGYIEKESLNKEKTISDVIRKIIENYYCA